jgi:hypothetical protein
VRVTSEYPRVKCNDKSLLALHRILDGGVECPT